MKIERHPAVIEDDLPGIYAYISRDNPSAAEAVLEAIATTLACIAAQPESGVLYSTRNPKINNLRMLPVSNFKNYLIFYRIQSDSIRVLYVVLRYRC